MSWNERKWMRNTTNERKWCEIQKNGRKWMKMTENRANFSYSTSEIHSHRWVLLIFHVQTVKTIIHLAICFNVMSSSLWIDQKKSFNLYALHIEQNNDKHSFLSHIYVYYSWVSFLCSNERVCRQPWTSSAINRAFRIFISILFGYYACIVCNCSCSFKISSVPQILLRRRERKRERWAFFFCFR